MKLLKPVGLLGLVALWSMATQAAGQEQKPVEKPVEKQVEKQREKPNPQVAVLGVETRAPTEEEVKEHDLPFQVRAQAQMVVAVTENSPAHEAGLVEGDFILSLDANTIYSQDDIADFLRVSKPGQEVTVAVRSSGEEGTEKVTLSLGGRDRTKEEASEQLRWQFASLGQLPQALGRAAAEKKKVIVGLSGAET